MEIIDWPLGYSNLPMWFESDRMMSTLIIEYFMIAITNARADSNEVWMVAGVGNMLIL